MDKEEKEDDMKRIIAHRLLLSALKTYELFFEMRITKEIQVHKIGVAKLKVSSLFLVY